MVSKKTKKITLTPPSSSSSSLKPLSRNSRMRNISSFLLPDFNAHFYFIKNEMKRGVDLNDEELKAYINKYFPDGVYCNELMGVSCGNNGGGYFDESVNFKRWYKASPGLPCPKYYKNGFFASFERGLPHPSCDSGCSTRTGMFIEPKMCL